jgi:signal transduction histidine kinase
MARIQDAREDIVLLLDPALHGEEVFDLVDVLTYVIKQMEPIAKQHPCVVVGQGTWPEKVPVRGIRYRIQRALTCLLDNGIKYSFVGQRRDGGGLHEVRIRVIIADGYVKVTMTNYGIGIPEEKLGAIRTYGLRGEVPDERRPRLGTGLGLPYAIDVFEEFGGWIHVTSLPASSATEVERRKYHRYITSVEAALPVTRRE